MRKRFICRFIAVMLCLSVTGGTACAAASSGGYHRYNAVIYDVFDTVITLIGYAEDQADFSSAYEGVKDIFIDYHRLFDGYHTYDGMENLCSVNRKAGQAPVRVDRRFYDFLDWCMRQQERFGSEYVNVAMGSVLQLWHAYREEGVALPPMDQLEEASRHMDIGHVILDPDEQTVFFDDPELQLDFGAVAKGYTAQLAADYLRTTPVTSFVLNAGGNICAGEAKADSGLKWGVGIQDPDGGTTGNDLFDTLFTTDKAVVTSGDYQRYYIVQGKRYAHLISPETLMPADHFRAVTIVADDSGLCDFLSTFLFIADYETGRALVDSMDGVEAFWILPDRSVRYTDGMTAYLKSTGATNQ